MCPSRSSPFPYPSNFKFFLKEKKNPKTTANPPNKMKTKKHQTITKSKHIQKCCMWLYVVVSHSQAWKKKLIFPLPAGRNDNTVTLVARFSWWGEDDEQGKVISNCQGCLLGKPRETTEERFAGLNEKGRTRLVMSRSSFIYLKKITK